MFETTTTVWATDWKNDFKQPNGTAGQASSGTLYTPHELLDAWGTIFKIITMILATKWINDFG